MHWGIEDSPVVHSVLNMLYSFYLVMETYESNKKVLKSKNHKMLILSEIFF